MKRKELFEFEDFHWLPTFIRSGVTNIIIVLHKLMGTADVIARLILRIKSSDDFDQIVDMGSGSGGPMMEVIDLVNNSHEGNKMKLVLSDYYPNPTIITSINSIHRPAVRYETKPVDATQLQHAPAGLKTMIASFHHMNPSMARSILLSAQDHKQPLLIFEIAKNNIPFIVWLLLLPLSLVILIIMSMVLTPFVRPLTFKQLFFTYLVPIIPLVYAWDGQSSLMRTYTFEDIETLLAGHKRDDYHWEINDAKKESGKKLGYYIMGYPLQ